MINMDIAAYQNMRISTRGKRPLRNLSPGDKVRAIQRIHNGETKASVSRDIGVPESTLRGWCKNEQKLRFMCRQLGAAMNEHQNMNLSGLEHSTEKRAKLVDQYECFGQTFAFNSLGIINPSANHSSTMENSANAGFNGQNFVNDKKDEAHKAFFKNMNAFGADSRFPQLPLLPNAHLLSFLNPNNSQPSPPSPSPPPPTKGTTESKLNAASTSKISLRNSSNSNESKHKSKRATTPNLAKNFASESLRMPKFPFDKNDTKNNNLKIALPFTPTTLNPKTADFPSIFPMGLPPFPLPTVPPLNTDNNDTPNNAAMLQWTKVFNASLNFLALAAAAAAIQAPRLAEQPEAPSSPNSDSSDTAYHQHQQLEFGLVRQQLEHSEDSNFDSEPEDLSVRSGTSKLSSPPQTPSRDLMSDSSILSDNEN